MHADENRCAARAVAIHAPGSPRERRELLDALGLLDRYGQVVPSPQQQVRETYTEMRMVASAVPFGHVDHVAAADVKVRPRVSTSPPGLRDYVPDGPEPGVPAKGRRRAA